MGELLPFCVSVVEDGFNWLVPVPCWGLFKLDEVGIPPVHHIAQLLIPNAVLERDLFGKNLGVPDEFECHAVL